ncbi:MAG: hypothetical protein JO336_13095 [Acidobacteriia bacterium]|nr:hypothetical protein [Terriglobia bacterium]MBV8903933.1 hypothetical protein [Terriglobia bacterium]
MQLAGSSRSLLVAVTSVLFSATAVSAQWLSYPTPGIPRLPDGKANLAAPGPRTADGRPDLSGIWAVECNIYGRDACFTRSIFFDLAKDLKPDDVQMTPWAAGLAMQRQSRNHVDDPYGYCMPPGFPRIDYAGGAFKILPSSGVTAFLYETLVGLTFRQVFTDGRPLPAPAEPSWLGYSVGYWDKDTFVVDTVGLKDGGWIDTQKGRPNSDALHVTERFRRTDFGHMDLAITIDDPKAYLKPWTATTKLFLQPDTELLESFCDSHGKTMEHRQVTQTPEPPSPGVR